jgi:hypothetical protein
MLVPAAAVASPAPSSTSLVTIVHTSTLGSFPFGAEQAHPVIDGWSMGELRATGAHTTLVVTVGDDGHIKSVEFRPDIDRGAESRIESVLQNAHWDPAVCGGGIPCEGRATITI